MLLDPYDPPRTDLAACLRYWSAVQPLATAFGFTDGEGSDELWSYAELDRRARAIGAELAQRGMRGERALLLFPPGLDFVAGLFGCFYAGAVAVPAYPPRRNRNMERIDSISADCGARVVLTAGQVTDRLAEGLLDDAPGLGALEWLAVDRVDGASAEAWREPGLRSRDLAVLQYTSGSTGAPKGVMLTHGQMLANAEMILSCFESGRDTVGVSWLPTYHDMGLMGGVIEPLFIGRPSILMSPLAFLQKPERWLRTIARHRATTSGGPNFAYELCVQKVLPEALEGVDLSCWELAFNGAEPIRASTLDQFARRFAPLGFRREALFPCYGMAEATLIVTGGRKADPPKTLAVDGRRLDESGEAQEVRDGAEPRELVGCGRALLDETLVVVDPRTGELRRDGEVGEIWVRSRSQGLGYWNQPEATRAVFDARLAAPPSDEADDAGRWSDSGDGRSGFLRTGDLGFLQDGELYVTGRLKDLIIVRGVNRYPQDVERTVERASDRLQPGSTVAFAIDREGRERLVVVAEVQRTRRTDWEDVLLSVRKLVALEHDLTPDAVVLVRLGGVPKTSSGKVQRSACREAYVAGRLTAVAEWTAWSSSGVREAA